MTRASPRTEFIVTAPQTGETEVGDLNHSDPQSNADALEPDSALQTAGVNARERIANLNSVSRLNPATNDRPSSATHLFSAWSAKSALTSLGRLRAEPTNYQNHATSRIAILTKNSQLRTRPAP